MRFLDGLRVLEFCELTAGPFCGLLLADLGAEVIKIEPPAGDAQRQAPPLNGGFSETFAALNRGKRSVVLDLADPAAQAAARRLARDADVVIESHRPGALDRLGLGFEALTLEQPKLVYCSLSPFGQEGPRAAGHGLDLTLQALSGLMSATGEEGGRPVKCGVPLPELAAGLYAAYAIAAALLRARQQGRGARLDVSLLGASLGIGMLQAAEYQGSGLDPQPLGSGHAHAAPHEAFRAADGFFALAAGDDASWLRLCDLLGLAGLADDPRFRSDALRARHREALRDLLEARFRREPAAHWVLLLSRAGLPAALINSYSAVLEDPQVLQQGWLQAMTLPGGAQTRALRFPVRIDGATGALRPPPALGADTDALLADDL